MVTPFRKGYLRISDAIETVVLLLQVLVGARFVVDLLGFGSASWASALRLATDPLVVPWHALLPAISVRHYVFDPGAAASIALLPILGSAISMLADAYRLRQKEKQLQAA